MLFDNWIVWDGYKTIFTAICYLESRLRQAVQNDFRRSFTTPQIILFAFLALPLNT